MKSRSMSLAGLSESASDAEPKLTNEAQRLLEEEQKLAEKEAQTSGRERAEVLPLCDQDSL